MTAAFAKVESHSKLATGRGSAHAWLQRKCACGGTPGSSGECEGCRKKREVKLQRRAAGPEPDKVPPIVHEVLRSPGQPLDAGTRAFMEPRFGHDFSQVRVHTGSQSMASTQAVGARAYTVGSHMVFAEGHLTPETAIGRKLLAHELTHVVQQQSTTGQTSRSLRVDTPESAAEHEAERHSTFVAEGRTSGAASAISPSGPLVQRQPLSSGAAGTQDDGALLWESFRQSITLENFDSDKATVKPEHLGQLKEYKERFQMLLGRYPDSFISVIGHTDATDTEEHNKTLGQQRADAVKNELTSGDNALPAETIHSGSLGESRLAVETKGRESRNRRVEIIPQLRRFFKLPPLKPSQPFSGFPGPGSGKSIEPGIGLGPFAPGGTTRGPAEKTPEKNWLEDALTKDPIIKNLPDWAREKVIGALKDGDEMLAEKVIDALPLDGKTKAAVQAVVKSLLQMAKGKKFKVPVPLPREPDFGPKPEFPKMPGEVIIPGPTFRF